jgi:hypothetical protein
MKLSWTMLAIAAVLLARVAAPVAAEGFRNITSISAGAYFDGTWLVESQDVLLAGIVPNLTLLVRVTRDDYPSGYRHQITAGPIVNITDILYFNADYGLTLDSTGAISHEGELEITYETDTSSGAFGIRGDFFPTTGYFYMLPSMSGKFHPLPDLGLFGKIFVSWDATNALTSSFWGEADWRFTDLFSARAGFTLGWSTGIGYSVIAGTDFRFTQDVTLKYTLEYASNTVVYVEKPRTTDGINNTLVLDVRF